MNARAAIAASVLAMGFAASANAFADAPPYIASAVADSHRPDADRARDALRKPAEVMAFAGVKPGDKVLELLPGRGYFTRVLSAVTGPAGHVYTLSMGMNPESGKPVNPNPLDGDAVYGNVSGLVLEAGKPVAPPEPVNVIFTAQNYHDLHLSRLNMDVAAVDKQFFAALKPGGVLVIEDHAAVDGSGLTPGADGKIVPETLHRIDEAVVKREAAAAGFIFDGETDILRNPADPRTALVFDPSVRGHTDQFLLRFRKPAS